MKSDQKRYAASLNEITVDTSTIRPTGSEIFAAKTRKEQDEMLGPAAAALVRAGIITLDDLYGKSNLDSEPDFITQKPLSAVT